MCDRSAAIKALALAVCRAKRSVNRASADKGAPIHEHIGADDSSNVAYT